VREREEGERVSKREGEGEEGKIIIWSFFFSLSVKKQKRKLEFFFKVKALSLLSKIFLLRW
jgi:hypothetical protein